MQMKNLNLPSPIQSMIFQKQQFYLKRDDLIHSDFSGNKARKFYYFLQNDFPDVKKVVSYGSAQSNAMYSLSVLAKMKGWEFEYTVDHIAEYLKENPHGNYKAAMNNGMHLIIGGDCHRTKNYDNNVLYIEEGGRQKEAAYGIQILAKEIISWQKNRGLKNSMCFYHLVQELRLCFCLKLLSGRGHPDLRYLQILV